MKYTPKVMEDDVVFEKRMEEIGELLPIKYRNPKSYRPRTPDYRACSLPPYRDSSVTSSRASSVPRLITAPLRSLTPLRTYSPPTPNRSEKVDYNYDGLPIYYRRRALAGLLEPSSWVSRYRITRDPWWWDYPYTRPYYSPLSYERDPYYLRSSYLSPITRTYLWGFHPLNPFTYSYFWE